MQKVKTAMQSMTRFISSFVVFSLLSIILVKDKRKEIGVLLTLGETKKNIVMGHVGTHFDIYGDIQVPLDYMLSRGILFFFLIIEKD